MHKNHRSHALAYIYALSFFFLALLNWYWLRSPVGGNKAVMALIMYLLQFLDMSFLVTMLALLASNLIIIALLLKRASQAKWKRWRIPALICLSVPFVLPLLLIGSSDVFAAITSLPPLFFVKITSFPGLLNVYWENFRGMLPSSMVLASSFFIAIETLKTMRSTVRKEAYFLTYALYLILPLGSFLTLLMVNKMNVGDVIGLFFMIILPFFSALGALGLTAIRDISNKLVSHLTSFLVAVLSCIMMVELVISLILSSMQLHLSFIISGFTSIFDIWGNYHIILFILDIILMIISAACILLVLVRGFLSRTVPIVSRNLDQHEDGGQMMKQSSR